MCNGVRCFVLRNGVEKRKNKQGDAGAVVNFWYESYRPL